MAFTRGADAKDAQANLTPDGALQELIAGNQRFAANRLTSIEHDLKILKEHTVDKQEPFAAVLACADSRVPVELVFESGWRMKVRWRTPGTSIRAGVRKT
jgi:hypothetical protein